MWNAPWGSGEGSHRWWSPTNIIGGEKALLKKPFKSFSVLQLVQTRLGLRRSDSSKSINKASHFTVSTSTWTPAHPVPPVGFFSFKALSGRQNNHNNWGGSIESMCRMWYQSGKGSRWTAAAVVSPVIFIVSEQMGNRSRSFTTSQIERVFFCTWYDFRFYLGSTWTDALLMSAA